MSERYVKVFASDANLYTEGSPLVICAGALLKDTVNGNVIAQLKLQNIGQKSISYVKIAITPLDSIKKPLSEAVSFEYLDVSIAPMNEFGSKTPILLPHASTRAFTVGVSHVGFADGSIWTSENTDWKSMAEDSPVVKRIRADAIYKQATVLFKSQNPDEISKAQRLFESISAEKDVTVEIDLCQLKISKIMERKAQAEKAKEESKEKSRKLIKKIIKLGSIILSACVVLALAGYFAIYPLISYMNGDYTVYINMYNVEEFEVPDGVTSIDEGAFLYCESLTSVTIPDSVTSIGRQAFFACHNLESVTLGNGLTSIGEGAFLYCDSLTSITIPNSMTSIGREAFEGCTNLENVTILDAATSIGGYAFDGCTNLKSVTLGNNVTKIGFRAFADCDSLTSITIPDSMTSIGDGVFDHCDSLESVTIPDSVTSIGPGAFERCTNLKSVTLGNGVTSIGWEAFYSCESLTSITIPDSVTSIGEDAFGECTNLKSVTLGNGVTSIGWEAFEGCTTLKTVFYAGTEESWSAIDMGYSNSLLASATRYYYSKTQPTTAGNYWHYVDGVPTKW